jgi:hypothetical protein
MLMDMVVCKMLPIFLDSSQRLIIYDWTLILFLHNAHIVLYLFTSLSIYLLAH